jgi:hypothetical protein
MIYQSGHNQRGSLGPVPEGWVASCIVGLSAEIGASVALPLSDPNLLDVGQL